MRNALMISGLLLVIWPMHRVPTANEEHALALTGEGSYATCSRSGER